MQTTVLWTHVLESKVALHIHHRGGLDGRYVVSRLWPDCSDEWNPVALWPIADDRATDWPTVRLNAAGEVVVQAAHELALRVIGVARATGRAYVAEVAREVAREVAA